MNIVHETLRSRYLLAVALREIGCTGDQINQVLEAIHGIPPQASDEDFHEAMALADVHEAVEDGLRYDDRDLKASGLPVG